MRALLLACLLPLTAWAGDALPLGWFLVDPSAAFRATSLEGSCGHPRGLLLASRRPTTAHATAVERFLATPYLGQRLRLTATATTREVKDWAGIWMRVDGADPERSLAFDNMQDRPLTGTGPCRAVELVLDVPPQARSITAGLLLEGEGEVELSDLRFEAVPPGVPSTDLLARGVTLRAPGKRVEVTAADPGQAVARVVAGQPADFLRGIPSPVTSWFSDHQLRDRGLALDLAADGRWTDATGESTAAREGEAVRVDLEGLKGLVTLRRDGPALLLEGSWGERPIAVRMLPASLAITWGDHHWRFWRGRVLWEDPHCVWYFDGVPGRRGGFPDERHFCGQFLDDAPPAVPAAVLLLRTVQVLDKADPASEASPELWARPYRNTGPVQPNTEYPDHLFGPNQEPLKYYNPTQPPYQPVSPRR